MPLKNRFDRFERQCFHPCSLSCGQSSRPMLVPQQSSTCILTMNFSRCRGNIAAAPSKISDLQLNFCYVVKNGKETITFQLTIPLFPKNDITSWEKCCEWQGNRRGKQIGVCLVYLSCSRRLNTTAFSQSMDYNSHHAPSSRRKPTT